ncbi:MAG: Hsp20/alpha crystallin family protein [Methanomicrobiales archaeon]
MAWRRRQPWIGFEDMIAEMENMLTSFMAGVESSELLPAPGMRRRFIPALRGDFRVDVREHEDEVMVVADMPGVERDDISIRLLEPSLLEISSERTGGTEEEAEGYVMRERMYGTLSRSVALPADVSEEGASASFKNGVLEVRLKKIPSKRGKEIPIQ